MPRRFWKLFAHILASATIAAVLKLSGATLVRGAAQPILTNASAVALAVSSGAQPAAAAATVGVGDAAVGRQLFTGKRRFTAGGPPCMACHSVGGLGALGGGAVGPDLTQAYTKFGPEGLELLLSTIPFPTMQPIFGQRALTEEERAHLIAFLEKSAVQTRSPQIGQLISMGGLGALMLTGISHWAWRRRSRGVRKGLFSH